MTLAIGIIIGLVLGLTGAGGSVFAVPLLYLALELPIQQAIGISLGAVSISSLFATVIKLKSNDIQWFPVAIYASIGGATAPIGNWANQHIDDSTLMFGFGLLVLSIAIRLWKQAHHRPIDTSTVRANTTSTANNQRSFSHQKPLTTHPHSIAGIGVGALLTGFLSGLFGVGGGFIIVPTLLFLTNIAIKQAITSSLVIITIISASGFASFLIDGNPIDTQTLGLVAVGGMLGMTLGMVTSKYIAGPILQKTFALLMTTTAIISLVTPLL